VSYGLHFYPDAADIVATNIVSRRNRKGGVIWAANVARCVIDGFAVYANPTGLKSYDLRGSGNAARNGRSYNNQTNLDCPNVALTNVTQG
jgi:hypothetical protein